MAISRRSFLGALAACPALWPAERFSFAGHSHSEFPRFQSWDCALVDLGRSCKLPESLAGYEFGLKSIGAEYKTASVDSIPFSPLIIVPGLASGATRITKRIREMAEHGSSILVESGALFHGPSDFEDHRRMLRSDFSIDAEAPVALWEIRGAPSYSKPGASRSSTVNSHAADKIASLPYIDYCWPIVTKIRDYSRAIPVAIGKGGLVASSPGGIPVAVRRRLGLGSVLFLGSPVGPSILSGDLEACSWLHGVVARASLKS